MNKIVCTLINSFYLFLFSSDGVVKADADLDDRDTLLVTPSESPFPETFLLFCSSSSSSDTDDPAETFSPKQSKSV